MQAVSGRHGLAAPVPTSCAVAHPSSPAFMLGTISLLAQEQYSTLSIPTNPRQTHPLRPPGMQLAVVSWGRQGSSQARLWAGAAETSTKH